MTTDLPESAALFAPGKLFVSGEWAILEGAPALVASVPAGQEGALRFVRDSPEHHFDFDSEGFAARRWIWRAGCWEEVSSEPHGGAIDVVGEVVRAAVSRLPSPLSGGALRVTPRGLSVDGQKLGFGSSGAIAALVARALAKMGGGAAPEAIFEAAFEGHKAAQRGRGSGADVAVSVYGQSVRVELPDPPGLGAWQPGSKGPKAEPLPLLDGLSIVAVWSGASADTRLLMAGVEHFKTRAPEVYAVKMGAVANAAKACDAAWRGGDVGGVLAAARESHAALGGLGEAACVPIVVPIYDDIAREVSSVSPMSALKLSGAGGGDMALVLTPGSGDLPALMGRLRGLGYRCLEVM